MSNSRQGVGKKLGTEDGRQETVLKVGIRNRRQGAGKELRTEDEVQCIKV
jgi:hypothetical protein